MLLKLFNGDDFQLHIDPTTISVANLPDLTAGEQVDIEFTLMTRTADDLAPWTLVSPGSYSLQIGLFVASDRSQLAYQNTFADDTGASKKTGTLALDTAAIYSAIYSVAQVRCVLEVRIEDATGASYPYRNKNVVLLKPFITPGTLTVPPSEAGATESWSKALFVPKDGSNAATPCDQIILKSRPSGLTKVLWIDDDGIVQVTSV